MFPGGKREGEETSWQTCVGEMFEETGLVPDLAVDLTHYGAPWFFTDPPGPERVATGFLILEWVPDFVPYRCLDTGAELFWVSNNEMLKSPWFRVSTMATAVRLAMQDRDSGKFRKASQA
jgi:8-oxo-dGTP pyrophosphatase MutT (NUDIX family)